MEWNGVEQRTKIWKKGILSVRTFVIRVLVAKPTIRCSKRQIELILSLQRQLNITWATVIRCSWEIRRIAQLFQIPYTVQLGPKGDLTTVYTV